MQSLNKQVGGNHYTKYVIQPVEYAMNNRLNMAEASIVKYITRHKDKNGDEDLLKALHFGEILIEYRKKQGYITCGFANTINDYCKLNKLTELQHRALFAAATSLWVEFAQLVHKMREEYYPYG